MNLLLKLIVFIFLTIITQVGGIIFLLTLVIVRDSERKKKRFLVFLILYLASTLFIIPQVAPIFGRVKIDDYEHLKAKTVIYKLLNRNYVKPELNDLLHEVASEFTAQNPGLKLIYLDANFPFIDGFPLLPHLSHNDGEKIDVFYLQFP